MVKARRDKIKKKSFLGFHGSARNVLHVKRDSIEQAALSSAMHVTLSHTRKPAVVEFPVILLFIARSAGMIRQTQLKEGRVCLIIL